METKPICELCGKMFSSNEDQRRHKWREHTEQVSFVINGGKFSTGASCMMGKLTISNPPTSTVTLESRKTPDGFLCPFQGCKSKCKYPDTWKLHIERKHDSVTGSSVESKRPRDGETQDEDALFPDTKMQKITTECLSLPFEHRSFAHHDYNNAILAASDALHLADDGQEQKLLLARCGRWEPLSIVDEHTSIDYNMLAGHDTISRILEEQPRGEFKVPQAPESSKDLEVKYSSVFNHICMHGALKNILRRRTYKEMDDSISELLNEDWQLCPQMRYTTSRMFSGAILFEGNKTLLINCAEVYGRQKTTDAHCERYTQNMLCSGSSLPLPFVETRYKSLRVTVNNEDNSTKLKIGTRVSNILATSSVLLGANTVDIFVGPSSPDIKPINPYIFLDAESITEAKKLFDEGSKCWRLRPHDILAQLRQVRSKFHRQSTYTLCRASSELTDLHIYHPYTIWTLANASSSVPVESQEKHASKLFQIIALAVIQHGREAKLVKSDVQQVVENCQSGAVLKIFTDILEMFCVDEISMKIINNQTLEMHLQKLAATMVGALRKANETVRRNLQDIFK